MTIRLSAAEEYREDISPEELAYIRADARRNLALKIFAEIMKYNRNSEHPTFQISTKEETNFCGHGFGVPKFEFVTMAQLDKVEWRSIQVEEIYVPQRTVRDKSHYDLVIEYSRLGLKLSYSWKGSGRFVRFTKIPKLPAWLRRSGR